MVPSDSLFRTIETSVRPARIAVLLDVKDTNWMQTCLRVIEWTTSLWGGWYTCFIPTDGISISEQFWEVLERFDPDYVYKYEKSGLDLKLAEPERFQTIVDEQARQFTEKYGDDDPSKLKRSIELALEESGIESFEISDVLCAQLSQRINPFQQGKEFEVLPIAARPERHSYPHTDIYHVTSYLPEMLHITNAEVEGSLPIQLIVYAQMGKTWPELVDRVQKTKVQFEVEIFTPKTLHSFFRGLGNGTNYAYALPLINLGLYHQVGHDPKHADMVVVVGDSLEDFCLYYAWSRMRGRTFWLPNSLIDAYVAHLKGAQQNMPDLSGEASIYPYFIRLLAESPRTRKAMLASCSVAEDNLQTLARTMASQADITIEAIGQSSHIDLLLYVQRLYDRNNVGKRYRDAFHNGESVNFVNTPTPKNLSKVPPVDLYWITDIKIENYQLPPRPDFGPSTLICPPYGTDEIRVTRDGFAYFCPHVGYFGGDIDTILIRPVIQVLEPLDIFERIFLSAGHHIQASDKGNYHLECLKKFGTLSEFAALWRNATMRRLFDLYRYQGKSEREKGDKIGDRRYLDFSAFEAIVREDEQLRQKIAEAIEMVKVEPGYNKAKQEEALTMNHRAEAAAGLIEHLLQHEAIHRGFVFKCNACRQLGWYAIADVSEQFECSRCRTRQVYTRKHWIMPNEPSWYYQLDEIVYEAYRNDGHVPTLTLDLMRRNSKDSFLYLPESELLKEKGAKQQEMELDFCCCIDGIICIGEAKKADKLENTDDEEKKTFKKYRDLADRVGASIIVFSTFSDSWNERTSANARAIIGEQRLCLYNRSQLLDAKLSKTNFL